MEAPHLMTDLLANRDTLLAGLEEDWLADYDWLQERLQETNVAEDSDYQRRFGTFFVFRGVTESWRASYFRILEREKGKSSVIFCEVLMELPVVNNRVEFSFTSKLVATVNPYMPVYDRFVAICLAAYGLDLGVDGDRDERLRQVILNYVRLVEATGALVRDNRFQILEESFDEAFPRFQHFTAIKKLDLFLWQRGQLPCIGSYNGCL